MHHNSHKSKYHEVSFKNSNEDYTSCGIIPKHGVELVPSDLEMEMNNTDEINQHTIEMDSGKNWLSSDGIKFQENLHIQNTPEEKKEEPQLILKSKDKEKSNTNHNGAYLELLELKVRKQASRLCELQEYKSICEKRILQLSPGHEIPITENHINSSYNNPSQYSTEIQMNNMIHSYKFQIQDLTNKLLKKEKECDHLSKKFDDLQKKHNHYITESIPKSLLLNNPNYPNNNPQLYLHPNENIFPNADRIPNEKMRDAYSKLLNTFRELVKEKEKILETLKIETINSEEQRNYIEILKQTIESSLQKSGIFSLIEKQKNLHYKNTSNSSVDVVIDIVQLRNEIEKCRRESILNDVAISEMKSEIEFLRDANNQMLQKKEKIKQGLEKGIKELEEAKEKVSALEREREYLSEDLNEMKESYENLLRVNENLIDQVNSLQIKNEEYIQKLENQYVLEDKIAEYKNNMVQINNQMEELCNENRKLQIDNEKLKTEKKKLEEEIAIKTNSFLELEEKHSQIKMQNEKILNKNNELKENLTNSIKLFSETEKNLENFKIEYEKISKQLKENLEKNSQIEDKYKDYEQVKNERDSYQTENTKLKKANSDLTLENERFRLDASEFSKNFNKLLKQYESLNKTQKNLENLNTILKIEKENLSKELTKMKNATDRNQNKNSNPNLSSHNSSSSISKKNSSSNINTKINYNTLNNKQTQSLSKLNANSRSASPSQIENPDEEIKKLKEELKACKTHQTESENFLKIEISNLKIKIETLIKEKSFLESRINEREKYLKSIQDDNVEKKNSENSHSFKMVKDPANFEWEMLNQDKNNEKIMNELRSYKNDNKKLYDYNKKLQEENSKISLLRSENQNIKNLTHRIINFISNKDMARGYGQFLSYMESLTLIESEKIKISKKIQFLEKEIFRIKTDNNRNLDTEIKLTNEIKNFNNLLIDQEKKFNEIKQLIIKLENELKLIEEEQTMTQGSNVFKANYIEKEKNSNDNFSFDNVTKISNEDEKNMKDSSNSMNKNLDLNKPKLPNLNKEIVLNNISIYNSNRSVNKNLNNSRNSSSPHRDRQRSLSRGNHSTNSARASNKVKNLIKKGVCLNTPSTHFYKRAIEIKKK